MKVEPNCIYMIGGETSHGDERAFKTHRTRARAATARNVDLFFRLLAIRTDDTRRRSLSTQMLELKREFDRLLTTRGNRSATQ